MDIININAQEYYLAKSVRDNYKLLFKGCLSVLGKIITRYNLSNDEFTYARNIDGELVPGKNISNKVDKLYLSKAWVDTKLVELGLVDIEADQEITKHAGTQIAPDILELKDKEKITDDEGNTYEIEIRGERHPDKIYFKVKDVSILIDSKNLCKNILNENGSYIRDEDYVCFKVNKNEYDENSFQKSPSYKRTLFFSYLGFLKCMFISKNKNTSKFKKWVTNVVFTAHLGTKPQKQELAAKLIGTSRETVREVFSKSTTNQSCIYLIYLGKACDLTKTFKITDYEPDELIYKFGRTINLSKRMDQHYAKYSKLGCVVELVKFANIDPIYNVDAENDIKEYFTDENVKVNNKKYVELVKLNKSSLELTVKKYEEISNKYMGHYTELNNQIKVMKESCNAMKQKCRADIAEKDNELLKLKSKYSLLKQKLKYKLKLSA